jgi:serum/glucocorticoid-regulated kinase 2
MDKLDNLEKIEVKDRLNFICDKNFHSIIPQEESLLWSGDCLKINFKGKRQARDFIITDDKVYNLGKKGNFIMSLFSKPVKRCFRIENIKAITYSNISNNFIMHIPTEYDYYLCTPDKDEFIRYLLYVQRKKKLEPMKFYMVEDIDLFKHNRYEGQTQEKLPNVTPQRFDMPNFDNLMKQKQKELEDNINKTEVIVSEDGAMINENSFEILKTLGKGYFGRVFLVEKKDTKDLYALKVISKLDIIKRNFFDNLKSEKKIMQQIKNPFVVNLEYCFASPSYVFFAMKFKQGGELYYHLRKMTRFPESTTKFYACQIIQGLAYLHSMNIMYRDMKPENVLLDEKGNACLADFGISKVLNPKEMAKSFVGTPEYVAPEIVLQKGHNKAVDIWCFGVLLYEMVFGIPPFYNKNQNVMLNWVVKLEPTFPKMIKISDDLTNLISQVI